MKKAIVTGASGFIGRHLINTLTCAGVEVWAVVRRKGLRIEGVHMVYCSLGDIKRLPELIRERDFHCFYHLAWEGSSGDARKDYVLQLENARNCAASAEAASAMGCRRFIGTGSVTQLMYRDYLNQDGSTPDPVTCYAIGKMAGEYLARCVCTAANVEFIWTYISNFYGVGDHTQNFINFLIRSYMRETPPALTPGKQLADFMYVTDVAQALCCLGDTGRSGSTYYVGYGEPRPLCTFVSEIRDLVSPGTETGLGAIPFRGMNVDFDACNLSKLQEDTDFRPSVPFVEGIKKTYTWLKTSERGLEWIV